MAMLLPEMFSARLSDIGLVVLVDDMPPRDPNEEDDDEDEDEEDEDEDDGDPVVREPDDG